MTEAHSCIVSHSILANATAPKFTLSETVRFGRLPESGPVARVILPSVKYNQGIQQSKAAVSSSRLDASIPGPEVSMVGDDVKRQVVNEESQNYLQILKAKRRRLRTIASQNHNRGRQSQPPQPPVHKCTTHPPTISGPLSTPPPSSRRRHGDSAVARLRKL